MNDSAFIQEVIALGIVGLVVLNLLRKITMLFFGPWIARNLLKMGKVKWAMAVQHKEKHSH